MKKLFVLVLIAFITRNLNAQKQEVIISIDTIPINTDDLWLMSRTNKATGQTTYFFRFYAWDVDTDLKSFELWQKARIDVLPIKAYLIANNYSNGTIKASKIIIQKK